jgi:hypothetical protein
MDPKALEQTRAAEVLRAEQGRRLEAELVALVKQHGLVLSMAKPVKDALRNVAQFNDFQQLQGILK